MRSRAMLAWAAGTSALLSVTGCRDTPATAKQCRAIFDRIVEIELEEMGFSDPPLAKRAQESLATRHRSAIAECVGRPISESAMGCVAAARTTEELSHRCLR